ncbi:MAG: sulfite exporter TauE/SafE family protein [Simkaniaceae bacterium]|nr:sulfite exporter TauE/SafE family protein [Simkaniaceae bacterium]
MFPVEFVAFVMIGIVAGFVAGLMGISGGMVIVPCLAFAFYVLGMPDAYRMHVVIGTAFAAMVFGTFVSSHTHRKHGRVLFHVVKPMTCGLIVGAVIGACIVRVLSGRVLRILFGTLELVVGGRFLLSVKEMKRHASLPSRGISALMATFVGILSTVLGIGGGLINVPLLLYLGVPTKQAIGTASLLGFVTCVLATCSLLIAGWGSVSYPHVVGWIHIPACIGVGMGAACSAPAGAGMTAHLPARVLHKVFGSLLLAAGLMLIAG